MSYLERLGLLWILWSLLLLEAPPTNVDRSWFLTLFVVGGILFLSGEKIRLMFQESKRHRDQKKIEGTINFRVSTQNLEEEE